MKIKLDASNFQSCDNEIESTTYYGGSIEVNDETYYCSGSDRGNLECLDDISDKLGLDDEQYSALFDYITSEHVGEIEL